MSIEVTASTTTLSARVASEIRAEMARQKMSGRELARRLERSPNWVSLKVSGSQVIDLVEVELIANALGLTVQRLIERTTRSYAPTVSGTVAHPNHPFLAGAATIRPIGPRRTAPTGV